MKHAFTEKGATECQAIKPAHQFIALPAFDRVAEPFFGNLVKKLHNLIIDPGIVAVLGAFGAAA